jgi:hypothetical protein
MSRATQADRENAESVWRAADALVARAAKLEEEARALRREAERLNGLAADWADGRLSGGAE